MQIYLDHASTTPVDQEVLSAMLPWFSEQPANASSLHSMGQAARIAVEENRAHISAAINAAPDEIIFTSGGTEANNWAIKGHAPRRQIGSRHILVSSVEHHSCLDTARSFQQFGDHVEFIPVDSMGIMEPLEVARRIKDNTSIVIAMHANNEVGTIQPIQEIGQICRDFGVHFHCDAVQSAGSIHLDVEQMNVSTLSISAHKLYGPKGVGALYVRSGTPLRPLLDGGRQEFGMRGGTYNVPGIVGFGHAIRFTSTHLLAESSRLAALRDKLMAILEDSVPGLSISGDKKNRLSNNVHFCVEGIEGESLLIGLDQRGISASAGAACSAGSIENSHVLEAMGVPSNRIRGAVRMSLGKSTTEDQIVYAAKMVLHCTKELRGLVANT